MSDAPKQRIKHIVTGVFGFIGKYIVRRLLQTDIQVLGITNSHGRIDESDTKIPTTPYNFTDPEALATFVDGAEVLYNTYWIRFNQKSIDFATALRNTQTLLQTAKRAGVKKVVHISVINANPASAYEYYSHKALAEQAVVESGLEYTILRPPIVFGLESVLINNLAWSMRRMPVVPVMAGDSRVSLIYADDLAQIACAAGIQAKWRNQMVDTVGPQDFSYREFLATIGDAVGKRPRLVAVPLWFGLTGGWMLGKLKSDKLFVPAEIKALRDEYLYSNASSLGTTKFTAWISANADQLGQAYVRSTR